MKLRSLRFVVVLTLLAISLSAVARAGNPVVDWNQIALNTALTTPGTQLYLNYVHLAMYDAVNAIDRRYRLYGPDFYGPPDASIDAAAISAAYHTLLNYFPGQASTLQSLYDNSLATIPDGQQKTDGIAVGLVAATRIVALRTGDGRAANVPYSYPSSPVPGVWIATPPAFAPPVMPWVAEVVPFTMRSPSQFLPVSGPPDLGSREWVRDFNEVKVLGAANSSVRTADQTAIALFWTANPTATWYTAFGRLPAEYNLDVSQSARLLAMLSTAFNDTTIACFNAKYHYSFWRPVTAIANGDIDGNPDTIADAGWLPLGATPPHPEFPAAHTCAAGTIARTLLNFFGTPKVRFTVSSSVTQTTRTFSSTRELEEDAFMARIYAGFHYRNSLTQGLKLGQRVAEQLSQNYFQPRE